VLNHPIGGASQHAIGCVGPVVDTIDVLVPEFIHVVHLAALVDGLDGDLLVIHVRVFLDPFLLAVFLTQDVLVQQDVVELPVLDPLQDGVRVALRLLRVENLLHLRQQLVPVEVLLRHQLVEGPLEPHYLIRILSLAGLDPLVEHKDAEQVSHHQLKVVLGTLVALAIGF